MKTKIGRNDPCPCGSGKKYKKCCMGKAEMGTVYSPEIMLDRYKIRLKTPEQIEGIRRCGRLVIQTFEAIKDMIVPGVRTDEINQVVHDFTVKNGATPAPPEIPRLSQKRLYLAQRGHLATAFQATIRSRTATSSMWTSLPFSTATTPTAIRPFSWERPPRMPAKLSTWPARACAWAWEQAKPGNIVNDISAAIQTYAEGQKCSVGTRLPGARRRARLPRTPRDSPLSFALGQCAACAGHDLHHRAHDQPRTQGSPGAGGTAGQP